MTNCQIQPRAEDFAALRCALADAGSAWGPLGHTVGIYATLCPPRWTGEGWLFPVDGPMDGMQDAWLIVGHAAEGPLDPFSITADALWDGVACDGTSIDGEITEEDRAASGAFALRGGA